MYKYFAFISYNYKDTVWGRRVQKKLENYRMPSTLCSEHGWERKPIKPVFFAPTDIQPGGLTAELQDRLKDSRNLIVICSPNSAKSKWVGEEIAFFHSLGRTDNIHFFIVDGNPHSGNEDTECFNPIIEALGMPEILGANIHEKVSRWPWINRERAYVQLVTKLLSVEFDSIWQRHKRLLIEKCLALAIGAAAVLAALLGVWTVNQPVDVQVRLNEISVHNDNLPPLEDAIVKLTLDNESKTDTIQSMNASALFANIPHRAIGKEVHMTVTCKDWLPVDTTVFLAESMSLDIARDTHPYGDIQFLIWNIRTESAVPGIKVSVNGIEGISDDSGRVYLTIPLDRQNKEYFVECEIPLRTNIINTFPTQPSTALIVN